MRFRILPLEERILFDASGASNVVNSYHFEHADVKTSTTVLNPDHSGSENPGSDPTSHSTTNKTLTSDQNVNLNEKNSQDQSTQGAGKSLLIVSSQVANAQQLMDSTQSNVETLYYDTAKTSLTDLSHQIQNLLDGKQAESIGFVSYGMKGAFSLTSGNLVSLETLSSNTDLQMFWKDVGGMVANGGRIDLLACSVAGSPEGTSLIHTLDHLIDNSDTNHYVNIAASSDITGNNAQGGNWNLEIGNVNVAKVYFAQTELSHWDGALDVPYMVKDIASSTTSSSPSNFTAVGNTIFFTASDGTKGVELWKTDGTAAGTAMVKDIFSGSFSSNPSNLVNMNGTLYFSANSSLGTELWKSDGTSEGTVLVKDINTSGGSSPSNFLVVNTTLFFSASNGSTSGIELWKTDGTASGTVMVKDIFGGGSSSSPSNLTNIGGTVFFSAETKDGIELWKSDGTSTGTIQVKDINLTKGASSNPDDLINVNGTLFFTANSGTTGTELWKSDGTATGTVLVKDIYSGSTSSNPTNLVAVGNTLYFTANTATSGVELWKSDGTSTGTVMVKDIYSGASSSNVSSLTNINETLYFKATDATSGTELWKSDGSSSGTVMIKDISPGTSSSSPSNFVYSNGKVYFTANDGANGLELWRTDGTSSGTVIVQDINSGTASASPTVLINVGTKLYFSATTTSAGTELWAYNTTVAPVTGTDNYSLNEDSTLTVNAASGLLANDTDADFDTTAQSFTITSYTNPTHGTLNYLNPDGSFKYTPSANFNGTDTFTYTVTDGTGNTTTGIANIAISPQNDAFSAVPAGQTINEDSNLIFNASNGNLISVSDAASNTMQVSLSATNGLLTLKGTTGLSFSSGDGTSDSNMVFTGTIANINAALNGMTFAPTANFNGTANIAITTKDEGSIGATNNISVTVNPMNDALSSVPVAQTINEDSSLVFNSANNNLITVSDATMNGMQVTLNSTNGVLTLSRTTGLVFLTGDGSSDVAMSFIGSTANINAALNGMTFTPTANFNGLANIAITTKDEGSTGATNNISVTVAPMNDALSSVPGPQIINEDAGLIFNSANNNLISVSDAVMGTIQVTLSSTNGALTLNGTNGLSFTSGDGIADSTMVFTGTTASINAALNGMTFNPTANFNGSANIAITTKDEGSTGVTNNVAITVNPMNDALSSVPGTQTVNEDTSLVFNSTNNNLIAVSDAAMGTIQVTLASTNGALTLNGTNGLSFTSGDGIADSTMVFTGTTANINAALNGMTFTPTANFNGSANIALTTKDEGSTGATNNIAVTVNPMNDALSSVPGDQTINEDTILVFNSTNNNLISVSDAVSNTLQVTLNSTNGALTLSRTTGLTFSSGDGTADSTMVFTGSTANINAALNGMTFTPTANFNGSANIAITTKDEGSTGATNNIAVTVNPINDALSSVPEAQTISEDSSLVFNSANNNLITVSDAATGTMQVTLTSSNGALSLSGTNGLSFTSGDGTADSTMVFTGSTANINAALNGMTFTPTANFNGSANIAITTKDEGSFGATNNIAVTVNPINDALSSVPGTQTVNEDTSLVFNSANNNLITVSDAAMGTMQVTLTSTNGALTLNGTNGLSFTSGDGIADSTMVFTGTTANINAALNGMTFTPTANFNGSANIALTTKDEGSTGATNNIAVTVNPMNDALSSVPGEQTINEDTSLVFNSTNNNLISVNDAVSNTIEVTLNSTNGALTLSRTTGLTFSSGDGTADSTMVFTGSTANINAALNGMTFTPTANFNGSANIGITTKDEGSIGSTNNIAVTVNPINDALSSVPGAQSINEDSSLIFDTANNNLITVNDAATGTMQVTLTSTNGALTLNGTNGLSFTSGDGTADSTMVFTGTTANINAALNGMTFTPTANFNGSANIAITTKDEGSTGDTNNIAVTVNPINDALSSIPETQTINEDSSLVFNSANNNLIAVSDAAMGTMEVTLTSTNGALTLSRTNGLSFTSGDGTADNTMVFTGTTANINAALNGMTFTPTANFNGSANIAITTKDEGLSGATNNIAVTVNPMNDALSSVPGDQTINEDTSLVFNSTNNNLISVSDAVSNTMQVTLNSTNGALTLSRTTGLTFSSGDGTADSTMVFTGSTANINAALNGMTFTPTANFNGSANIAITTKDEGAGGATKNIGVTVNPMNDALSTVPEAQRTNEDVCLIFNSANNNLITVNDAASNTMEVTLTSTNGALTLTRTTGLTFSSGDGIADNNMVFTGSAANINAALNGMIFTPTPNFNGLATIGITTKDEGLTGSTNNIAITVDPMNDALPSVPAAQTINENATLIFNSDNNNLISVSDAATGTMQVTLSSTNGTLTLNGTHGLNFSTGDGTADNTLVFTGTTANINSALNGMAFTPTASFNGYANITIATKDEGVAGAEKDIAVIVNPMNDALSSVPGTQIINEDATLIFNSANNNLIAVSDAIMGTMEVTLTSNNGALTLSGTNGLNFSTGNGIENSTMTFTGSTADINAALNGMTFTPTANFNGLTNIAITTKDEGITGITNEIAVTVNSINDALSTVPESQTINEDSTLVFNSLNNNLIAVSDAAVGTMQVTLTSTHGALTLSKIDGLSFSSGNGINNSTMTFTGSTDDINAALNGMTFTPTANFNGLANIVITTKDEGSTGATNEIAVTVNPVNDALSSVPDAQTINEDGSLVFNSANNNLIAVNDAAMGTMQVTLTSTHGALTLSRTDGLSFSSGNGTDNNTMTFSGSTADINAALNGMTFTPTANFNGSANIAITTKDEGSTGETNDIAITINPINDALSSVPGAQTIHEDTSLVFNSTNNNLITVSDGAVSTMEVTLTSTHGSLTLSKIDGLSFSNGNGIENSTMTFTGSTADINAALNGMTFTPIPNFNGSANISITTKDESSLGSTNEVAVTVNPINDALSSVPGPQTIIEDASLVFNTANNNLIAVSDAVMDTIQVSLTSNHGTLTLSKTDGLTFSSGNGTENSLMTFTGSTADINAALNGMTFTPTANFNGSANIAITTLDEGLTGTTNEIAVIVNPMNDALSSIPESQTINEDSSLIFNSANNNLITVSDAAIGTMQVTLTSTHGALTLSRTDGLSFSIGNGTDNSTMTFTGSTTDINAALDGMSFTPIANFHGLANISISTKDEGSSAVSNEIAVTVNSMNDAFTSVPGAQFVNEDAALVFNSANNNLITVSDAATGSMEVTLTTTHGALTLSQTDGLSFSNGNGTENSTMTFTGSTADINAALNGMTFTPTANFNGSANIAITTQDEGSIGSTNNIAVTINPMNDALSSIPITQSVSEDASLVFSSENNNLISVNDSILNAIQVTLTTTHGTLNLSGTSGLNFLSGDGTADTVMTFTGSIADVNAALNGMSFIPAANYHGTANISITTQDEGLEGTTNNIAIVINPVNDAFSTLPNAQTINEDSSLIFSSENNNLISVSDTALDTIQVTLTSINGSLTLNGTNGLTFSEGDGNSNSSMTFSGSIADINAALNGMSFDPIANYNGEANISITTHDEGVGITNHIPITINPINDAVATVPNSQTTNEDSSLLFNLANNNLISIDSQKDSIQVTLTSTNGTLTLNGTAGLSFSTGNGTNNNTMTFTGSVNDINAALNGMSFQPIENFNGQAKVSIAALDEGVIADTHEIEITVNPVNDAFSSVPDSQIVNEDSSLVFNLSNDNLISVSDAASGIVKVTLSATHGSLSLNGTNGLNLEAGDGSYDTTLIFSGSVTDINNALNGLTFTPIENYNGTATISITTIDEGILAQTNNISVDIIPLNDSYSIVPTSQVVNEDATLVFSETNGNQITVNEIYEGTMKVILSAPHATLSLNTTEGLNFIKGDGQEDNSLIFIGSTANINRALNGLTLTPLPNYNGSTALSITTLDEGSVGETNLIAITVNPTNDALSSVPSTQTINEDGSLVFNNANGNLVSVSDAVLGTMKVTLTSTNGTLSLNGTSGLNFTTGNGDGNNVMVFTGSTADINAALNGMTFNPVANYNGSANISITTLDEGSIGTTHNIGVIVNPVNDALSSVPTTQTISEDSSLVFNAANGNLISVNDAVLGIMEVTLTSTNGTLSLHGTSGLTFSTGNGNNNSVMVFTGTTADINAALNGMTFNPIANYNGSANISITTLDEGSVGTTNNVAVIVNPFNDALSFVPTTQTISEDSSLVFNAANGNLISVSDAVLGTMEVTLTSTNGTLSLHGTSGLTFSTGNGNNNSVMVFTGSTADINAALNGMTFNPIANYNGSANISITTLDEGSVGTTNNVAVIVNPINDALSFVPTTQTISEDSSLSFNAENGNLISVSDAFLGTMEVTLTSTNGTLSLHGTSGLTFSTGNGNNNSVMVFTGTTVDINAALNGMTFNPIANFNGSANISITTLDEGSIGTTNNVAVIVNPINDALSSIPTTQTISEDSSLVFNAANGNLISVNDSALGTMELTLTSTNGTLSLNGTSGLNFTTGNGNNNSVMTFTGTIADINAALNGMTYSPLANYNGSANISITTLDEGSVGETNNIAVIVNPINDALSLIPTTQTINEDSSLIFNSANGNLISVNDAMLGTMEVTLTSTNGTLSLHGTSGLTFSTGDGNNNSVMVFTGTTADINTALNGMSFSPIANFNGSANISITTLDEGSTGTTNHIAIIVNPINDALSSVPTTQIISEDTSLVFNNANGNLISVNDAIVGTMEVTLTSTNGTLSLHGTSGLTFSTGNGNNNSVMVFTGNTADINAALNGMTFNSIANYNGSANISITTLDEGSAGMTNNIAVIVNPINDAFSSVPTTQIISEDTSLIFNNANGNLISVNDAVLGTIEVTLTSTNGTLSLHGTSGLTFSAGNGNNNSVMVFTGNTIDINAALNGMKFNPVTNYNGSANISITTLDEGSVGTTNNVAVIVNPINDGLSSIPTTQTISEDSNLVFNSANGNLISVSDAVLGTMEVTLTSTNGTLSLHGTSGLTFSTGNGNNNNVMVFTGTAADINAALNGMSFNPRANYNGSATISITTLDEGSVGVTNNIAVVISPTNDAYSTLPSDQNITEDSTLIFNQNNNNLISVSNSDTAEIIEVTLTSTNGHLSLGSTAGITFTTGNGTNENVMIFSGKVSDINSALNGLSFIPNANFNGLATISITTLNEGLQGELKSLNIQVDPLNDAIAIVPDTQTINQDTSLIFSSAKGNLISINSTSETIQVTLTVTHGTLTLSRTQGLSFSGGDGIEDNSMIFSGSPLDINSALDGMSFNPTNQYIGNANISITAIDEGLIGSTQVVGVNINATTPIINLTPTPTESIDPTVTQDHAFALPYLQTNTNIGTLANETNIQENISPKQIETQTIEGQLESAVLGNEAVALDTIIMQDKVNKVMSNTSSESSEPETNPIGIQGKNQTNISNSNIVSNEPEIKGESSVIPSNPFFDALFSPFNNLSVIGLNKSENVNEPIQEKQALAEQGEDSPTPTDDIHSSETAQLLDKAVMSTLIIDNAWAMNAAEKNINVENQQETNSSEENIPKLSQSEQAVDQMMTSVAAFALSMDPSELPDSITYAHESTTYSNIVKIIKQ